MVAKNKSVIKIKAPVPNFRPRLRKIKYIILHCSTGTPEQQRENLIKLGLSTHYIIGKDGKIMELVSPENVAYHAGLSRWEDCFENSLNDTSIGIEMETDNLGQLPTDYTRYCIRSLCALLEKLVEKYHIRKEHILGHSDVSPTRKPDPGPGFPWLKLYRKGFVYWYHSKSLSTCQNEIMALRKIGYNTGNLSAARYAFCRHWIPEEIAIETDIQKLLDNPYPEKFVPQDIKRYLRRLSNVCVAVEKEKKKKYWYPPNPDNIVI